MDEYHELVQSVLTDGNYKPNRTGVDTISLFGAHYDVDLEEGFPLLTTKQMDGYRWDSMIHELFWYLSGEAHIRNLRENTKIWDAWADDEGRLDTAYGRFWRRFPLVDPTIVEDGEDWVLASHDHVNADSINEHSFDQIGYILDTLKTNPNSRRMVLTAWHPGNAAVSKLPPCHYTAVFNVQGEKLNCHLTQRSGDVALGVPFNLACYSLLTHMMAQEVDLEPGTFSHTIVDAHVYCGTGDRGEWWSDHTSYQRSVLRMLDPSSALQAIEEREPPADPDTLDHIPGLLSQLSRDPLDHPELSIADKPFDELGYDDIELEGYESHDGIFFGVAE